MHRAFPVLAAILFLLQPAFADKGNGSDGERYRQEDLFDARRQGDILPLGTILDILRDRGIIDILEVESEYENGRMVYEIYFLDSEGRRGEVHVDAATGRITDGEDDDQLRWRCCTCQSVVPISHQEAPAPVMRILVIEDDDRIRADLTAALEASGYVVDAEADGEEGWHLGDTETYAAAILDLGLPTMDGLSILKRWRNACRDLPVLVLTARGTWTERVEGIDAGADDYLPKPFKMEELLARLRAILRRSAGHASSTVRIGDAELDTRQMRLSVRGVPLGLSPQEYRLVAYLVMNKGRVVSQQELAEHLQSVHFERESNAVEVLVGRVRRKLPIGLIETRRGFGYIVQDAEEDKPAVDPADLP